MLSAKKADAESTHSCVGSHCVQTEKKAFLHFVPEVTAGAAWDQREGGAGLSRGTSVLGWGWCGGRAAIPLRVGVVTRVSKVIVLDA